jgi:hypothetical protein
MFVLAMVLHPECQREAHEEINSVVGTARLPQFSDREALPFVECVYQEVLRFVCLRFCMHTRAPS